MVGTAEGLQVEVVAREPGKSAHPLPQAGSEVAASKNASLPALVEAGPTAVDECSTHP